MHRPAFIYHLWPLYIFRFFFFKLCSVQIEQGLAEFHQYANGLHQMTLSVVKGGTNRRFNKRIKKSSMGIIQSMQTNFKLNDC